MLEHDGHESIRRPGLSSDIQQVVGQRLAHQHPQVEAAAQAQHLGDDETGHLGRLLGRHFDRAAGGR